MVLANFAFTYENEIANIISVRKRTQSWLFSKDLAATAQRYTPKVSLRPLTP